MDWKRAHSGYQPQKPLEPLQEVEEAKMDEVRIPFGGYGGRTPGEETRRRAERRAVDRKGIVLEGAEEEERHKRRAAKASDKD